MTYLAADLITAVRERAELDTSSTLTVDAMLLRFINRALAQISLEASWPWLRASASVSSVIGTNTLTLPTGWLRTHSITDTVTGYPLQRRASRVIDRQPGTGRPEIYAVDGSVLYLAPVPTEVVAYTHRYSRSEPELTTGAPLIPEVYSEGVILWAAARAFTRNKQPDKAAIALSDYAAWLVRVKDNCNQSAEVLSVEPRPGGWL